MKYCHKCGNELKGNEKFCSKCGEEIVKNHIKEANKDSKGQTYTQKKHSNTVKKDYGVRKSEKIQEKQVKSNRAGKIIASIIGVACVLAIVLVIFKNDIIYKYHMVRAEEAEKINEKIDEYYYATEAKYNSDIINTLYNELKNSDDVQVQVAKFDNIISKDDINKLYSEIYSNKAEQEYDKNEYDKASNFLSIAEEYGYNVKKFSHYKELQKKLKEQYEEKNNKSNENNKQYINNIVVGSSDYIIPNSSIRYLTVDELNSYNKNALALIRNEIFARHGYVFQSQPFRNYFQGKTWYSPNASFKGNEDEMNQYEKANINLILNLENKRN